MIKVFKFLSYFLLLVILVLLALLIPPHLQVRKVGPALPTESELLALRSADGPTKVSYITTSTQAFEPGGLAHTSILIEWATGKTFLIDAGMDATVAVEFGALFKSLLDAEDVVVNGTISELLGKDISQVQGVGFTHLHSDHTQGLINFCEARDAQIIGLQTTYQKDMHNFGTSAGGEIIASSCLDIVELKGNGLNGHSQFPGLAAFPLGGHTPGSTLWAVALKDQVLLFSGDITNSKSDLLNDVPKQLAYSYLMVPENVDRSAELRRWLAELDAKIAFSVVVSHDLPNAARVLPEFSN